MLKIYSDVSEYSPEYVLRAVSFCYLDAALRTSIGNFPIEISRLNFGFPIESKRVTGQMWCFAPYLSQNSFFFDQIFFQSDNYFMGAQNLSTVGLSPPVSRQYRKCPKIALETVLQASSRPVPGTGADTLFLVTLQESCEKYPYSIALSTGLFYRLKFPD